MPAQNWSERVAHTLAPDAYLSLGVAGARAAEIRAGQLAAALALRPGLVILAAGANDAVRRSFRPDRVEAELAAMIEPLSRAGTLLAALIGQTLKGVEPA
jgi:lysophospholipase L1-like esterase